MAKRFHVYIDGKPLMSKASAAQADGAAALYMAQGRSVWVTSQPVRD